MTTNHTPGTWRAGKTGESVVSDQPLPGYDAKGGHDHVEYYGGYLIAESIWRAEDRALIAAAPELLAELEYAHAILTVLLNLVPEDRRHEMAERLAKIHDGEGAVRSHERRAAIARAKGEQA